MHVMNDLREQWQELASIILYRDLGSLMPAPWSWEQAASSAENAEQLTK